MKHSSISQAALPAYKQRNKNTNEIEDKIKCNAEYNKRLRQAAGRFLERRASFNKEVLRILKELQYGPLHIHALSFRLWKRGPWRILSWDAFMEADSKKPDEARVEVHHQGKETSAPATKTCPVFSNWADMEARVNSYFQVKKNPEVKFLPHGMDLEQYQKQIHTMILHHACPEKRPDISAQCYAKRKFISKEFKVFTPTSKEYTMEIKTQTLVNGHILESLSDSDLINFISDVETQISTLLKVDTKSVHITNKIEGLRKNAAQLAGFLDTRGD
jgi:hypothetical protein